ncbi:hypothetical protein BDZ89DRAFT_223808 [Hymenopellis radicata]|nr:hypothetical protein BDZ89DRAFT_223808 [Hymenopellis radicata]
MSNTALCTDALEALTSVEGLNSDPLFLWVVRWVRAVSPDYQHAVSPVYLLLEHVLGVLLTRYKDLFVFAMMLKVCTWRGTAESHCTFSFPDADMARAPYEYERCVERHVVSDVLSGLIPLLLPRFRQSNDRIRSLASLSGCSQDPQPSSTLPDFSDILLCLDIAESVSKMVPGFGSLAEGACGIIRKIIAAVENARVVRSDVLSLANRTATLTIAILNEVASLPGGLQVDTNLMDFWV